MVTTLLREEKTYNKPFYFDTYHAFTVGINAYQRVSKLQTAIADATDIGAVLKEKYGYKHHPCPLNPTRIELETCLHQMAFEVNENDCVVFYFGGHGIAENSENGVIEGFICPADVDVTDYNSLNASSIRMDYLHDFFF